jgi:hypothetical protein
MSRLRIAVVGAAILTLALTSGAFAQRGPGPRDWYGRMYNPQTVETISGQVMSVDTITRNRFPGMHLTVQTDKETVDVHLGPAWYIDQQPVKFAVNESVEVTGSRVTVEGKPAIIAAEVKKDDQSLKLRDATTGIPAWAGRGRRR